MKRWIILVVGAIFAVGLAGCAQDTATAGEGEGISSAKVTDATAVEMVTCPCGSEHPKSEMEEHEGQMMCADCVAAMKKEAEGAGEGETEPAPATDDL